MLAAGGEMSSANNDFPAPLLPLTMFHGNELLWKLLFMLCGFTYDYIASFCMPFIVIETIQHKRVVEFQSLLL